MQPWDCRTWWNQSEGRYNISPALTVQCRALTCLYAGKRSKSGFSGSRGIHGTWQTWYLLIKVIKPSLIIYLWKNLFNNIYFGWVFFIHYFKGAVVFLSVCCWLVELYEELENTKLKESWGNFNIKNNLFSIIIGKIIWLYYIDDRERSSYHTVWKVYQSGEVK